MRIRIRTTAREVIMPFPFAIYAFLTTYLVRLHRSTGLDMFELPSALRFDLNLSYAAHSTSLLNSFTYNELNLNHNSIIITQQFHMISIPGSSPALILSPTCAFAEKVANSTGRPRENQLCKHITFNPSGKIIFDQQRVPLIF